MRIIVTRNGLEFSLPAMSKSGLTNNEKDLFLQSVCPQSDRTRFRAKAKSGFRPNSPHSADL